MRERTLVVFSLVGALVVGLGAAAVPAGASAQEAEPPGLAEPNPQNPPFVRRWKRDRLEDFLDRREDVRDRLEDLRDRREDVFDRRDDRLRADALERLRRQRHEAIRSGDSERAEALGERIRSLHRRTVRDRREDLFDRREDFRDRREDFRDRRHEPWRRHGLGRPSPTRRPYRRPGVSRPHHRPGNGRYTAHRHSLPRRGPR